MELSDAERYAAAALFTLALHATQLDAKVDDLGRPLDATGVAWGCAFFCCVFLVLRLLLFGR
jgi:hypothetical protein